MLNSEILLKKRITFVVFAVILAIVSAVFIGYLVAPEIIYDQWIWKYYWGPVVADAAGHSVSWNGVVAHEGYTFVSTVTYGLIMICALYGLYLLLKKLRISVDWYFCVSLLPYILFGPVTRVLEDTGYFSEPAVYWFISPLLYLQTTAYVLVFLFLGVYLEKKGIAQSPKKSILFMLVLFVAINIINAVVWTLDIAYGVVRIEPWVFSLLSGIAFFPLVFRSIQKKTLTTNTVIFSGGLLVLLPGLFLIGRWLIGHQWSRSYGLRFDVFVLIASLVFLILLAVYLFARIFHKNKTFQIYKDPLNLSMLAGHMIDGITTYISIYDPLHMGLPIYWEKHPASNMLMMIWPPLFPIVKFLMIMVIIYIFDVLYKKELHHHLRLVNLLKICIFILGVSPGIRGLLRVTMGV